MQAGGVIVTTEKERMVKEEDLHSRQMVTETSQIVNLDEMSDVAYPQNTSFQVNRKKQAASFNVTSSNSKSHHSQTKNSASANNKTGGSGGSAYSFRNVPSAAEQRALRRMQKQSELSNGRQGGNQSESHDNSYAVDYSNLSAIERKSSKRQFAFAQPPPMNSASRRHLRIKQ